MYTNEILREFGGVDKQSIVYFLKKFHSIDYVDIEKIIEASKQGRLYISETLELMDNADEKDMRNVYMVIIPTCYNCQKTGHQLCMSFIKSKGTFKYYVTKTMQDILETVGNKQSTQINSENLEELKRIFKDYIEIKGFGWVEIKEYNDNLLLNLNNELSKAQEIDIVHNQKYDGEGLNILCARLYDRLLDKENWMSKDKNKLEIYITYLINKVSQEQKFNSNNGYVNNTEGTACCINTGLIDEFSNDIFIVDLSNKEKDIAKKKLMMLEGKIQLIDYDFTKEQLVNMPKPIKFYKNKSDLIFDGTIDEFDIDNSTKLKHIVMERNYRIPDEYREYSPDMLCSLIRNSVISAVKMSERDYKYFVPMYNFQFNEIQFLVPIYLGKTTTGKPDLAAIVGYYKGYYCVNTIINIEVAYDNARLISKPNSSWLGN